MSAVRIVFCLTLALSACKGDGNNGNNANNVNNSNNTQDMGADQGGVQCDLPVTGLSPAPAVVASTLGVETFRYTFGTSGADSATELLDADGDVLATYTQTSPNRTVQYFNDAGSGAVAGPIHATLQTTNGDEATMTITSRSLIDPFTPIVADPVDGVPVFQVQFIQMEYEISFEGRTLYLDESFSDLDEPAVGVRLRVREADVPSPPTVGDQVTEIAPIGTDSFGPVTFYQYTFSNDSVVVGNETDGNAWMQQVGLSDWETSPVVQMLMATAFDRTWQAAANRELIRCLEGDDAVAEFDDEVRTIQQPIDLGKCGDAFKVAQALAATPAAAAGLGPVGAAIFAASAPFIVLGASVLIASFAIDCLCTTDGMGVRPNITNLCSTPCSAAECAVHCEYVEAPSCAAPGQTVFGRCAERQIVLTASATDEVCQCYRVEDNGEVVSCGDPHIDTFSGKAYSPQLAGEFILAEEVGGDFVVQVRQEPRLMTACPSVTYNTAVATTIGGQTLHIGTQSSDVRIDGEVVDIPADGFLTFTGGGYIARDSSNLYVVYFPTGETLSVIRQPLHLGIGVSVPTDRLGTVQGLAGAYSDDPSIILVLRDGTALPEPIAWDTVVGRFADSWRITQNESLFYYDMGEATDTFTIGGFPTTPVTIADLTNEQITMASATCAAQGVAEGVAMDDCILDVACSGDPLLAASHVNRVDQPADVPIPPGIDFTTWTEEIGVSIATVTPRRLVQTRTLNQSAGAIVSPDDYIDHAFRGTIAVRDGDDDIIGFVFGYKKPLAANGDPADDVEAFLISWKGGTQDPAFEGISLGRINGVVDTSTSGPLWSQTTTPEYEVIAQQLADDRGWVRDQLYRYELRYSTDRIQFFLDGELIFDVTPADVTGVNAFETGRFGFYVYSQGLIEHAEFSAAPISP